MPQAENKTGHRAVGARGIGPGASPQDAGPCRLRDPAGCTRGGPGGPGVRAQVVQGFANHAQGFEGRLKPWKGLDLAIGQDAVGVARLLPGVGGERAGGL